MTVERLVSMKGKMFCLIVNYLKMFAVLNKLQLIDFVVADDGCDDGVAIAVEVQMG